MRLRTLAAILAIVLAPAPVLAQGAPVGDPPPQAALTRAAYTARAQGLIVGYMGTLGDRELIDLLASLGDDPSAYAGLSRELAEALRRVEANAARLDAEAAALFALKAATDTLGFEMDAVRPYVERLGAMARRQLDLYKQQVDALERGDVATFDALRDSASETAVALLDGENAFMRIQQSIVAESDALWSLFETMISQNELQMSFMRASRSYMRSGDGLAIEAEAVRASLAEIGASIATMRAKIEAACVGPQAPYDETRLPEARHHCDALRAANALEEEILALEEAHGAAVSEMLEGHLEQATYDRLSAAQSRIVALTDQRSPLYREIMRSGMALAQALR